MLEKYIVCDVCGLRSPSLESCSVLYITLTYVSKMQEIIMQGMQHLSCPIRLYLTAPKEFDYYC